MPSGADRSERLTRMLRCWGKTGDEPGHFHPALFHMLDVGHVAETLLAGQVSSRWRLVLETALEPGCSDWVPWAVALHDIGKISDVFQMANAEQRQRLQSEGFSFGTWKSSQELSHAMVSQVFLADQLPGLLGVDVFESMQQVLWEMAAGHHGQFCTLEHLREARRLLRKHEPAEWGILRAEATDVLTQHFLKSGNWCCHVSNLSAAIMALTGFAILCDWLGSDSLHFPTQPTMDLQEYAEKSRVQAQRAVKDAGFAQVSKSHAPMSFANLFPHITTPRPLQIAIDHIPAQLLDGPCLAIIEAPTGEGKTEAALALAHRLAQFSGSDELYYALPTAATSNQMFGRVQRHLRDHLGLSAGTKLVHGQAFLVEDDLRLKPLGDNCHDDARAALEWFGPKKRALLAPFGVGTIDQAELAALNVRHTALRMIGLAGKVVILDEVHAYDTYMTTVIERLLTWLGVLGASVVLLSATLPKSRRIALAHAFGADLRPSSDRDEGYPGLWVVGCKGDYHAEPAAYQPNRCVQLSPLHLSHARPEDKASWLLQMVAQGGCVCWITNTVQRAQETFEVLDRLAPSHVERMLLHSRFPLAQRQELESVLADKYGPVPSSRPQYGVVIGTQILEQSLDLDFDLMVSDLAPIDLLLQRAGRLHRHARQRPQAHARPRLWLNTELDADNGLQIDSDRHVYAEFFLRRTWEVLANCTEINLPADYRRLVEAVYGYEPSQPNDALSKAWDALQKEQAKAAGEARLRLLPPPNPEEAFCDGAASVLFDEEEGSTRWIVAQTRLGEDSVTAIPLEQRGTQVFCGDTEIDLRREPPRQVQLQLLRNNLRISRWEVVEWLRHAEEERARLFGDASLLRGCYPLLLTDSKARLPCKSGTLALIMDSRLGLVIRKENSA